MKKKKNIAVLLTCHNRKDKTINCLKNLYLQNTIKDIEINVYLVDDGSTDNTEKEIKEKFSDVKIIKGDGTLFWNGGMHKAFKMAINNDYDYYIWLNDDTFLKSNALETTLKFCDLLEIKNEVFVLVGSTYDNKSKLTSYGGYEKISKINPFKYKLIIPHKNKLLECDTMCGNYVVIPKITKEKIGIIEKNYKHRWGDVDYGIRVKKAGGKLYILPGHIGTCASNPISNAWEDSRKSLLERYKIINSIKGLHKNDWKSFTRRHGGKLWFLYWLSPYIKIFLTQKII